MPNTFFQFKQFRIDQDQCAMKVSTDACIQGAWTPIREGTTSVLDIGTGTGLLSLLLAQRTQQTYIDAIEIDADAAEQARQNVAATAWKERINIIRADALQYSYHKVYDLIVSNPPFFVNSLLGDKHQRNIARHNLSLSFEHLFRIIKNNLAADGYASILLPVREHEAWEQLLKANGWSIFERLLIIPRIDGKPNRIISLCHRNGTVPSLVNELIIRDNNNNYTPAFIHLLRPFYLNL